MVSRGPLQAALDRTADGELNSHNYAKLSEEVLATQTLGDLQTVGNETGSETYQVVRTEINSIGAPD